MALLTNLIVPEPSENIQAYTWLNSLGGTCNSVSNIYFIIMGKTNQFLTQITSISSPEEI